jgi:hypothetical protein
VRAVSAQLINAEENERYHIGQELHDDLAERITAVSIGLTGLSQKCNGNAKLADSRCLLLQVVKVNRHIALLDQGQEFALQPIGRAGGVGRADGTRSMSLRREVTNYKFNCSSDCMSGSTIALLAETNRPTGMDEIAKILRYPHLICSVFTNESQLRSNFGVLVKTPPFQAT